MSKPSKSSASLSSSSSLLLLIIPFFINADSFRPMLQSKAQEALGRNVQIGKLDFSLFSGALSADGITIADDPKFSNAPFVTREVAKDERRRDAAHLLQELHVNSIKLEQPQVALISNAAGQWNYSSLGGNCRSSPRRARRRRPQRQRPRSLLSRLRTMPSTRSISRTAKSASRKFPQSSPPSVYSDVDLTLKKFAPGAKMPFTLSLKAPRGGTIKADGTGGPINPNDASLTPVQLDLKNDSVEIAGLAPTSGMSGLLDMNAKFSSDGRQAHLEGTGTNQEPEGRISTECRRRIRSASPTTRAYTLASHEGTLTADVTARKNTAQAFGQLSRCARAMVVHMNLNGQGLSIDELESLLPAFGVVLPSGSSLRGGTLTANLNLQGRSTR